VEKGAHVMQASSMQIIVTSRALEVAPLPSATGTMVADNANPVHRIRGTSHSGKVLYQKQEI
jgi:hypothetical protein